ncbi:Peptidyl-prolyl cis-trans isomerase CYP40 [Hordeum vulgare]|nr:Peptidyl-prolyl cis-trans isomerase CYP40 [Hordeum vulgare]
MLGFGVAASLEAVLSAWRLKAVVETQPLRLRSEHEAWPSSDDVMARRARRARQRARDAAEALAMVDVGGAESPSSVARRMHQCRRHTRVVMDVGSFQKGFIIDLTPAGTVRVTGSNEEE